ncbi:unnamed protein product [Hyaloperonospora brassicae]|uniref:PH domain-containing protein n=1 Tax=Hyaloperonospora brassicae TaxID=162125 RepID=A0AAV0V0D3_HYABA|nr:unnamed protein product [Hyaloperonospora brassicae]
MSLSSVYGEGCAGWVFKQGSWVKNWKKRFLVLRERQLTYYHTDDLSPAVQARGALQVITVELSADIHNGLLVHGYGGRVLKLYTLSAEATSAWYNLILDATMLAPPPFAVRPFGRCSTLSAASAPSGTAGPSEAHKAESASESLDVGATQVTHAGWLKKQGARVKSWRRRYFVLRGSVLSYFDSEDTGAAAKGYGRVRAVEVNGRVKRGLDILFETGRLLRVSARTSREIEVWLCRLSDAIEAATVEQQHVRQSLAAHRPLRLSFVGVAVPTRMSQEYQQQEQVQRHRDTGTTWRQAPACVPSNPRGVTAKVTQVSERPSVTKQQSSSVLDDSDISSELLSQMSISSPHGHHSSSDPHGTTSAGKSTAHSNDAWAWHSSSSSTSFDSDVDCDSDDSEGDWI